MTNLVCLLRRLNICDGFAVEEPEQRRQGSCFCVAIAVADDLGHDVIGSDFRHARARAVARADETLRLLEQRARIARHLDEF